MKIVKNFDDFKKINELKIFGFDTEKSKHDKERFFFEVKKNDIAKIKTRLENGFDINTKDKDGNTALMLAVKYDHFELFEILLNKVFNYKKTLINTSKINDKNNNGETVLVIACELGRTEFVKELLESKKIDVNVKDKHTVGTPLIIACLNGYVDIAKLLINDDRVILSIKDYSGRTAEKISTTIFADDSEELKNNKKEIHKLFN
jgi:ankyrin repeat protein